MNQTVIGNAETDGQMLIVIDIPRRMFVKGWKQFVSFFFRGWDGKRYNWVPPNWFQDIPMNNLIVEPTINNCTESIISTARCQQSIHVSRRKTVDVRIVQKQNSRKREMQATNVDFFHYWLCLMLYAVGGLDCRQAAILLALTLVSPQNGGLQTLRLAGIWRG